MVALDRETKTLPDITSPDMIEECVKKEPQDTYDNEIETNIVTMDNGTENFPDTTYPDIMKKCGNKNDEYNEVNKTDDNINDMNERKCKFRISNPHL